MDAPVSKKGVEKKEREGEWRDMRMGNLDGVSTRVGSVLRANLKIDRML